MSVPDLPDHRKKDDAAPAPGEPPSLAQIFWLFLKIGAIAYGGAWAVVAVIDEYIVVRHKWLDRPTMVRGISLCSMLPGAVAPNVSAYVGYRLRRLPGALVAAFAMLIPAIAGMVPLTLLYFHYGALPAVKPALLGVQSAAIGLICAAGWKLASLLFKDPLGPALAFLTFCATALLKVNMVLMLILAGAFGFLHYAWKEAGSK